MKIAFYAPMKPPTSPVPSGDRKMARALIAALEMAGYDVELAAHLQSRDGAGDPEKQARLSELGAKVSRRLVRRYKSRPEPDRPRLWFSYHVYYKAPDYIGPAVADALGIPYVIAEASYAPKREGGPWQIGHQAAGDAIRRADLVFGLNAINTPCIMPLLKRPGVLVPLPPFLEHFVECPPRDESRKRLAAEYGLDPAQPWLLTVAMMRPRDKLASYGVLADAMKDLAGRPWQLIIVGDGPARAEIERAFDPARTVFVGEVAPEDLAPFWAAADLYAWPAVNEAYGMAMLEAQAAGLPVIAGATAGKGGVREIVRDGETGTLVPAGDAVAFGDALAEYLDNPQKMRTFGENAAANAARTHGIDGAAKLLKQSIEKFAR